MTTYVLRRILHAIFSVIVVVAIIMVMIYSMLDRNLVFASDPQFTKVSNNQRTTYKYRKWQDFGYIDYLTYADYLKMLVADGEIDEETRAAAVSFGRTPEKDTEIVTEYIQKFNEYCAQNGYSVTRLNAVTAARNKLAPGGGQQLFGYRDRPLYKRLITYFTGLIYVDNIHRVPEEDDIGKRGLTFTLHDSVYGGTKFAPAILGNGTIHKYLFYTDSKFPFIHQNLVTINLGKSFSVNPGVDVFTTMSKPQGSYVTSTITYPTGLVEESADDLHSAVYVSGSLETSLVYEERYVDDYTSVQTVKAGKSKVGYSFTFGIIATLAAYLLGLPLGLLMALRKEKLVELMFVIIL